ncbi:MAG: hypothetical protein Tsb0021_09120 [Chlamydiales bacterium]
MAEHYQYKFRSKMFETVMGILSEDSKSTNKDLVLKNKEHFLTLPKETQLALIKGLDSMQLRFSAPWGHHMKSGMYILAIALPPLLRAWLVLGMMISLLILLGRPGFRGAAWLFPLLAATYMIQQVSDAPLYSNHKLPLPSEQALKERFFSLHHEGDWQQLRECWNRFLIHVYANEEPNNETSTYEAQLIKGTHRFNTAQLLLSLKEIDLNYRDYFRSQQSLWILTIILWWSLCFAFMTLFESKKRGVSGVMVSL